MYTFIPLPVASMKRVRLHEMLKPLPKQQVASGTSLADALGGACSSSSYCLLGLVLFFRGGKRESEGSSVLRKKPRSTTPSAHLLSLSLSIHPRLFDSVAPPLPFSFYCLQRGGEIMSSVCETSAETASTNTPQRKHASMFSVIVHPMLFVFIRSICALMRQ